MSKAKTPQSWSETPTVKVKRGDVIHVPEINEWHVVGAISVTNGVIQVWYGLSAHPVTITRQTTKVAI